MINDILVSYINDDDNVMILSTNNFGRQYES